MVGTWITVGRLYLSKKHGAIWRSITILRTVYKVHIRKNVIYVDFKLTLRLHRNSRYHRECISPLKESVTNKWINVSLAGCYRAGSKSLN